MRYCPFCHRWNSGRPARCFYCGRTWHLRLCPRGHENPYDAQFCGTCGSADLTDTAGPRSIWVWVTRAGILAGAVFLLYSLWQAFPAILAQSPPYIIAVCFLLIAYRLALSVLPGFLKRPFLDFHKVIGKVVYRVLVWTWEKVKLVFS